MLTLFTGVPGAGKTAAGVDLLLDLLKTGTRPLYVIEIPEENVPPINLKIPHTLLGPGDAEKWHEIVPDGAIVYMPEAQRLWPARAPSQRVPAHVEAVGQHRHRGIDIVLDTQGPKLLDDKVRLRVGRHVHLRDLGILGRHWYEGNEVWDTNQWRSAPIKTRYRLPKRTFGLYKSASEHVKPVRKIPPVLFVFLLLVPLLLFLGYRIANNLMNKGASPAPSGLVTAPGVGAAAVSGGGVRAVAAPITNESLRTATIPRIADQPHSAPMFDHLRVVVNMPRIGGGYCLENGECRCYLQRGYRALISDAACREWIKEPPFDPYHVPEAPPARLTPPAAPAAPAAPPAASESPSGPA